MFLLEVWSDLSGTRSKVSGICDRYEEIWTSEERLELLCDVGSLTFYVAAAGLYNVSLIQFFLEKADGKEMFTDITYLVEEVERYIAENQDRVKSLLRLLGERLSAAFAAATPYPYSVFTLEFTNTLFHKLLESPCVIDMLLIRDQPSILAHFTTLLARIHAQKSALATTEIFLELEFDIAKWGPCLRGQKCDVESTKALVEQLQQVCPVEVDGDVAVIRR